jgi:hypothetical protein
MILDGYIRSCVNILSTKKRTSVQCIVIHIMLVRSQGVEKRPEWSKERLVQGPFIVNCSMFHRESFEKVKVGMMKN